MKILFVILILLLPLNARSEDCIFENDSSTVIVNGHELVITSLFFKSKSLESVIKTYTVVKSLHELRIYFYGPYGDIWEAPLTSVTYGRCQTYLIGKAEKTTDAIPYSQRTVLKKP